MITGLVERRLPFELVRDFKQEGEKLRDEVFTINEGKYRQSLVEVVQGKPHSDELLMYENVLPRHRLFVFGGGHVGQATSLIGSFLGFDVTVLDDREDILIRSRFSDSRIKLKDWSFEDDYRTLNLDQNTSIVIVTRGHQYDEQCLKQLIGSPVQYIGMIGSKRRVISIFNKLKGEGFSQQIIEKVHAPIGIDIGAKTPQEIGLAIMSEIIAHREGRCMKESCR